MGSTRLRPQASADDGKRRTAVLEVDVSPLRATKGGVWGGIDPQRIMRLGGSVDFASYVGSFFALVAHFFDFLTHLTSSCVFLTIFGDFS